jgi:uncharacterized membrane protein
MEFALPSPLHPAVVHFPIVLLLVGAGLAWLAVGVRRGLLPWLAALLLVGGAAGALVAAKTGDEDKEVVSELPSVAESLLDQHEEWGEWTRNVALVAAGLSVLAAFGWKNVQILRGLACGAALAATASAFCVYQTGHRGGRLVYRYGAGILTDPAAAPAEPAATDRGERHEKSN